LRLAAYFTVCSHSMLSVMLSIMISSGQYAKQYARQCVEHKMLGSVLMNGWFTMVCHE
jgi:hypothetical protein